MSENKSTIPQSISDLFKLKQFILPPKYNNCSANRKWSSIEYKKYFISTAGALVVVTPIHSPDILLKDP